MVSLWCFGNQGVMSLWCFGNQGDLSYLDKAVVQIFWNNHISPKGHVTDHRLWKMLVSQCFRSNRSRHIIKPAVNVRWQETQNLTLPKQLGSHFVWTFIVIYNQSLSHHCKISSNNKPRKKLLKVFWLAEQYLGVRFITRECLFCGLRSLRPSQTSVISENRYFSDIFEVVGIFFCMGYLMLWCVNWKAFWRSRPRSWFCCSCGILWSICRHVPMVSFCQWCLLVTRQGP